MLKLILISFHRVRRCRESGGHTERTTDRRQIERKSDDAAGNGNDFQLGVVRGREEEVGATRKGAKDETRPTG